jgi:hypothetical protein
MIMQEGSTAHYWMNETSGVLRPAVTAYFNGDSLTVYQIAVLRAYLSQWIMDPHWQPTANLGLLRSTVPYLRTRQDLDRWIDTALEDGIEPL